MSAVQVISGKDKLEGGSVVHENESRKGRKVKSRRIREHRKVKVATENGKKRRIQNR